MTPQDTPYIDVDAILPGPLPTDVLEYVNFALDMPRDTGADRQEFLFRFPASDVMLYAYVAVRWLPDPTAPGEHLQVLLCMSIELRQLVCSGPSCC